MPRVCSTCGMVRVFSAELGSVQYVVHGMHVLRVRGSLKPRRLELPGVRRAQLCEQGRLFPLQCAQVRIISLIYWSWHVTVILPASALHVNGKLQHASSRACIYLPIASE